MQGMVDKLMLKVVTGYKVSDYTGAIVGEVTEGEILEAQLYEPSEEYFVKDSKGREILVGEFDPITRELKLDDSYELFGGMNEREIRSILHDDSEVIYSREERIIFHAAVVGGIPLTIDAESIAEDLILSLGQKDEKIKELNEQMLSWEVGREGFVSCAVDVEAERNYLRVENEKLREVLNKICAESNEEEISNLAFEALHEDGDKE